MKRPGSSPSYKWLLLGMLFCLGTLNYCDRSAISAVLPPIRADLGGSDVGLAAIGSCFLWAYMLAAPFGGLLADRVSRTRVILLTLTGWSLVTLATAFVANLTQLLCTRVLLGLVEASYIPAAIALLADFHPARTRATAIGINAAAQPLGIIVGGASVGYMGDHIGWRPAFAILGLVGLVLAIAARFIVRDATNDLPSPAVGPGADRAQLPTVGQVGDLAPRVQRGSDTPDPARPSITASLSALLHTPTYVAMVLASMTVGVGNWIFVYWLPLYFRETYHMDLASAGFAGTFMLQGAAIAAGILGGIFSDRFARGQPRRRLGLQIVFYVVAAPFLAIFLLPHPPLWALNLCMFGFSFFLWFGGGNALPLICDLLAPNLRSTAISLVASTGCLAGGIGVLLAGFLKASVGLAGIFAGISCLALVAAGILFACHLLFPLRDSNSPGFSPTEGFPEPSTHS